MSERAVEATNKLLKEILTDTMSYRVHTNDAETLTQSGIYQNTGSMTNLPSGAYRYGVLAVFDANLFKAQVYIPHTQLANGYGMYIRAWYDGKWNSWQCYRPVEKVQSEPAAT